MAGRHQCLSRYLWEILDRNGVSECRRATTVHTILSMEITETVMSRIVANNHTTVIYIFGSRSEGTVQLSTDSDLDMVAVYLDDTVVNSLHDAGADLCLLLVWDINTVPGYVKLQLVYDGTPCDFRDKQLACVLNIETRFDNTGRAVRHNHTKENIQRMGMYFLNNVVAEKHGTALSSQELPWDIVLAHQCTSWPHFATEWLKRKREHNWPPSNMIHMAETQGCLFVFVGHPDSCEAELEWRLSFSLMERQLMFHLNEVQHKCYVLLKFIKSDIFEADSITSYQLKTCLFYCIERTRASFWQRDNLVRCLIYCLGTLLHWLRHGYCPHYFIKEQNMFRGKLDRQVRQRSVRLLDGILLGNCSFLLKIKQDGIGKQLAHSRRQNIETYGIGLQTDLYPPVMISTLNTHCHGTATKLLNHYLTSRNMDIASCIQSHETLLHDLYKIKTVSQHSETETRAALQYITTDPSIPVLPASWYHRSSRQLDPG